MLFQRHFDAIHRHLTQFNAICGAAAVPPALALGTLSRAMLTLIAAI